MCRGKLHPTPNVLPLFHGTMVAPSGRFPSERLRPDCSMANQDGICRGKGPVDDFVDTCMTGMVTFTPVAAQSVSGEVVYLCPTVAA